MLTQEGYEVVTVKSSCEAADVLHRNSYNLIFADIESVEEHEIDIIDEIRKSQTSAKIVIMSASSRNQVQSLAEPSLIFSIIEKPFSSEEIKEIARKALRG